MQEKDSVIKPKFKVDRTKKCPFLLKLFVDENRNWNFRDFSPFNKPKSLDETLIIHTWKDASLKELTKLVQSVHDGAAKNDSKLVFTLVYIDRSKRTQLRDIGVVSANKKGPDDHITLENVKFVTGDYICINIKNDRRNSSHRR